MLTDVTAVVTEQRMRDFLAYHFSGGPIPVVPEPSSFMLGLTALVAVGLVPARRRWAARRMK